MDLRARLKRLLPPDALNWLMLNFPIVYKFPIVSFESNMEDEALEDIGCLLATTALLNGDVIECGSSRCGTLRRCATLQSSDGAQERIAILLATPVLSESAKRPMVFGGEAPLAFARKSPAARPTILSPGRVERSQVVADCIEGRSQELLADPRRRHHSAGRYRINHRIPPCRNARAV